jgi:DNA-binding transcriptional LysR family regulator
VPVSSRYAASSVTFLRRRALAGLGVASVPEFLVEDDLATGRLVRLLEGWATGRGAVHLVYPSGRHLSPSVRALVALLVATFADHPP